MRKTRKLVSAVLAASMVAGIGMGSVGNLCEKFNESRMERCFKQ